jgi:DNA-binding NtrC family response regulator
LGTILIIDDDTQLRNSFEKLLTVEGHAVQTVPTGERGLDLIRKSAPDLVITDVRLPGMDGLETFEAIHEFDPKLPVIVMTAYGTTETAIQATKLGAFDYVVKPFEIPEMLSLIEKALDARRFMRTRVEIDVVPEDPTSAALLGQSKAMQEIYKAIGRVAPTEATVLIRGESGTGKELAARAVYQHSGRADRPFTVINCVAIPETLLESELFGYEKGSFTGAAARRIGKIEQANRGTVFLDEIGDMPVGIQSKILRLLQEKTIERLGGRDPIPVDVRVIAATNRNLEQAIAEGRFRDDLYYRLNVVTINLPALRQRGRDILVLADHFLATYSRQMNVDCPGFTDDAKAMMEHYYWPGNVRELANAVQKALIFSRGAPISGEEISRAISGESPIGEIARDVNDESALQWVRKALSIGGSDKTFVDMVDRFSELIITEALNQTGGNRSKAARLLGLSRPTLLAKIEKYGIKIETSVTSE